MMFLAKQDKQAGGNRRKRRVDVDVETPLFYKSTKRQLSSKSDEIAMVIRLPTVIHVAAILQVRATTTNDEKVSLKSQEC